MSGSASLGQLAVRAGLLPEADRVRLCAVVAERATSPQPVSLGRLLLKGGMRGDRLCTLLASGVSLDEVLCDGCGAGTAQGRLTSRDEFACRDCGALFFGFAAFASRRLRAVAPTASSTGADLGRTVEFGGVLPLPGVTLAMSGSDPVRTTVGYGVVLNPTPPGESDAYVFPGAVGRRSESEARSELAWIQAGLESLADETGAVCVCGAGFTGTTASGCNPCPPGAPR
ncbi:MAG TPA: hypothetical protein EYP98_17890, partial [Planctomycetes bacterium]|nr:hypothetical protein [Planctomycetota bacterium]